MIATKMLADVGQPVPDTAHAVSVSLPSWKATVGYEEGEDWVVSKMKTGYPRFFIHLTIQELEREVIALYGRSAERVMLFPTAKTAKRCQEFIQEKASLIDPADVRTLRLEPDIHDEKLQYIFSGLSCVFFPQDQFPVAKQFWQHTGDGVSSRRAEFCLRALQKNLLKPISSPTNSPKSEPYQKGPRRYQRGGSRDAIIHPHNGNHASASGGRLSDDKDHTQFIEERFGRNLSVQLAKMAKSAVKKRISGCMIEDSDLDTALANSSQEDCHNNRVKGLREDDVFLYPTGMSSIFNSHRMLMALSRVNGREPRKSICFGFPYIDTLKILEKFGPGCLFYGNGQDSDLDDLEKRLEAGERYLALFTEFPSNPLLRSPNLARIRQLADKYEFAVVVDETVGNFININVLSQADVVVSSLTKIFSGDCNVMGGSYVLNPQGPMYQDLRRINDLEYEDNYWAEDAVFLERNSRDFVSRIGRINLNASAVVATLQKCPIVKQVYYPSVVESKRHYDACRNPNGGYGGLLSVTFQEPEQAVAFFDALAVQKGPSLGTNFTLACPYTILAHYTELDWTAKFGVEPDLVRISFGLEETAEIVDIVQAATDAAMRY